MSEYLKRRFPLDDTSTVYMSGKAVYNLVRRDRPGIISSVELFPADAEAFRDAVRDAMAEAWDEGVQVLFDGAPDGDGVVRNPYREGRK